MARILSRLAIIPLLLTVSLVGVSSSYAFSYGVVSITSAPYAVETGDEPSISVHAEWSGVSGMSVTIGLKVRNNYGAFSYGANITSYDTGCMSGCQSNLADGKIDAIFSLTAGTSETGSSIYLYPTSLTIFATLSQCPNGLFDQSQCTVIATSQPVTITIAVIGEPSPP